jgi:hypothetical protein
MFMRFGAKMEIQLEFQIGNFDFATTMEINIFKVFAI